MLPARILILFFVENAKSDERIADSLSAVQVLCRLLRQLRSLSKARLSSLLCRLRVATDCNFSLTNSREPLWGWRSPHNVAHPAGVRQRGRSHTPSSAQQNRSSTGNFLTVMHRLCPVWGIDARPRDGGAVGKESDDGGNEEGR